MATQPSEVIPGISNSLMSSRHASPLEVYAGGNLFGVGIDVLRGETKGRVFREETMKFKETLNYETDSKFKCIKSVKEYNEMLDVTSKFSFSGWGSKVDGAVQVIKEMEVDEYSIVFTFYKLIKTKKIEWMMDGSEKDVIPDALSMLDDNTGGGIDEFIDRYSYHFVTGQNRGGYFIGYYKFQSSSKSQFEQMKVDLSAEINAWGTKTKVDVNFVSKFKSLSAKYSTSTNIRYSGNANIDHSDTDSINKAFSSFLSPDDKIFSNAEIAMSYICQPWVDHVAISVALKKYYPGVDITLTPYVDQGVLNKVNKTVLDLFDIYASFDQLKNNPKLVKNYHLDVIDKIERECLYYIDTITSWDLPYVATLKLADVLEIEREDKQKVSIDKLFHKVDATLDLISRKGCKVEFQLTCSKGWAPAQLKCSWLPFNLQFEDNANRYYHNILTFNQSFPQTQMLMAMAAHDDHPWLNLYWSFDANNGVITVMDQVYEVHHNGNNHGRTAGTLVCQDLDDPKFHAPLDKTQAVTFPPLYRGHDWTNNKVRIRLVDLFDDLINSITVK
ncbi:MAG: hypothetical protein OEZ43_05940 [Gammaproteobacteria bacterium]|nr:hypothetical protein [Gammaproteobacteria bacterium]